MAQIDTYDINSKYRQRKLREQAAINYANNTYAEKTYGDEMGCIVWVAILLIIGIIFIIAW
jgi:hypothetical protein